MYMCNGRKFNNLRRVVAYAETVCGTTGFPVMIENMEVYDRTFWIPIDRFYVGTSTKPL